VRSEIARTFLKFEICIPSVLCMRAVVYVGCPVRWSVVLPASVCGCMIVVCGGGREQIRQALSRIPPSIHITADCARAICIRACVFIRALCSEHVFLTFAYYVEYHCDDIAI